jgi:glutathione peroxidase
MKLLYILIAGLLSCTENTPKQTPVNAMTDSLPSIHQYRVEALDGGMIDFSNFKGKKILIVNTASECGYTPQYAALQSLYKKYQDKLVIVGFPCNDFGGQEPGDGAKIKSFCQKNYGVEFPMAAKVCIIKDPAPIYRWLTSKKENGVLDATVRWNFNKFLLDEQGHMLEYYPSSVSPEDESLISRITETP